MAERWDLLIHWQYFIKMNIHLYLCLEWNWASAKHERFFPHLTRMGACSLQWPKGQLFVFKILSHFDFFLLLMTQCLCASVPRKRFLGNYRSHHHQTWHSGCLRHGNASHVIYIVLDLHSRSHILIMKMINVQLCQKLSKQCPSSLLWR